MHQSWINSFIAALFFAVAGCGTSGEPVYPVSGVIALEGQPLAEALVTFHPEGDERRRLTAMTNAQGRFELTTHTPNDGAAAGAYLVTVEWRELVQEGDEKVRTGRNLLPPRYADPRQSGLRCEVPAQPTELPPWDLKRK